VLHLLKSNGPVKVTTVALTAMASADNIVECLCMQD